MPLGVRPASAKAGKTWERILEWETVILTGSRRQEGVSGTETVITTHI